MINTYLLNLILDKDWIVHVGAYCIRPTNVHDHGQMINPPYTFQDVCNTPLQIPDKFLINKYLLNPIPEKDWIVWIIMPIKPDTFLGVCYTPLPIRIKNLIPPWTMNLKLGTCWGVCNTPLHIRIKNLIPIYWMNLKLGRFLGICLCDQLHLGGKPLKFVWEHVKPAED